MFSVLTTLYRLLHTLHFYSYLCLTPYFYLYKLLPINFFLLTKFSPCRLLTTPYLYHYTYKSGIWQTTVSKNSCHAFKSIKLSQNYPADSLYRSAAENFARSCSRRYFTSNQSQVKKDFLKFMTNDD